MSEPAPRIAEAGSPAGVHTASPGAFIYMDAMRALLAAMVAWNDVWALLIRDYRPTGDLWIQFLYFTAGFGHPAVIMFFVLSGFWITRSIVRRVSSGWSWRHYLGDRLARLLVVLVPVLLLGGLLDAIGVFALRSPTHLGLTETYVLRKDVAADLSPLVLIGNLFFLQFMIEPYGTNGPLWSLAYEFWFYIWFPALWLLLRKRQASLGLLTIGFAWIVPELALAFISWLCGSLLCGLTCWLRPMPRPAAPARIGMLLTTGGLLVGMMIFSRFGMNSWRDPALAFTFALFLLALISANPKPLRLVRPLATYGAQASFSLYATHFPLMAFAAALLIDAERLSPTPGAIISAGVVMTNSIIIAWLFARCTEANTDRIRACLARFSSIRSTVS